MAAEQNKAPAPPSAEAALHAELRALAERAWREQGIRIDHVFISWQAVETIESVDMAITSLQLTSRTYEVRKG